MRSKEQFYCILFVPRQLSSPNSSPRKTLSDHSAEAHNTVEGHVLHASHANRTGNLAAWGPPGYGEYGCGAKLASVALGQIPASHSCGAKPQACQQTCPTQQPSVHHKAKVWQPTCNGACALCSFTRGLGRGTHIYEALRRLLWCHVDLIGGRGHEGRQ